MPTVGSNPTLSASYTMPRLPVGLARMVRNKLGLTQDDLVR